MKFPTLTALTLTLFASTNAFAEQGMFTATQQAQIAKIASQYLITHPEVLVKASETLQRQQAQNQSEQQKTAILNNLDTLVHNKNTPFTGAKAGKISVIEFFDYQCIFCSKIAPTVQQLQLENPDVTFIYKETPIFASRWPASDYAADMGNWVYKKLGSAAYLTYHDAVFASHKNEGKLTTEDVTLFAKQAGLTTQLRPDDDNNNVNDTLSLFSQLGFQGTPALIVMKTDHPTKEDIRIINGYDPTALADAIEALKHS